MIASPETILDNPKKLRELEPEDISIAVFEVNAVVPDEDAVVDGPKAAGELEPEERFGPVFVVMVVLPDGDGVLDKPRTAGGFEVEEMSVPALVVVVSLRNEGTVAEVGPSLTPGGEGSKAGAGTGSGGGHDCHSQTVHKNHQFKVASEMSNEHSPQPLEATVSEIASPQAFVVKMTVVPGLVAC